MTDPLTPEPRIIHVETRPSVAARIQVPMAELDLGALFMRYQPEIERLLVDRGVVAAGAPYGRYHQFGPEQVDVEIGVPVVVPPPDLPRPGNGLFGEISVSELPGGRAAAVLHLGSYDTLGEEYDRLHTWIHDHGHDEGPAPWESYLDDARQVSDPSRLRTEIFWLIA